MFNNDKFKCAICMDYFIDPVITQCGNIYCENCIKTWNTKNTKSPTDGPPITRWIKCPMIDSLCLFPRVHTDHKLVYVLEDPSFVCSDKEECEQLLMMIDQENHNRLNENSGNTLILIKIFSNVNLVKQLLDYVTDSWQGIDGWSIEHYIGRFGNAVAVENIVTNKYNLSKISHRDNWTPSDFILSNTSQLNSADQLKIIELLLKRGIDFYKLTAKKTPIHYITSCDNNLNSSDQLKALRYLLQLPSLDINTELRNGWRLIHFICAKENKFESADQLEAIKLCLDYSGIDLNVRTIPGNWRPIHFVIGGCNKLNQSDQIIAINLLLGHNIDLEVKIEKELWQPIHFLCNYEGEFSSSHVLELVKLFDKKNINFNQQDNEGNDPSMLLLKKNKKELEYFEAIRIVDNNIKKFKLLDLMRNEMIENHIDQDIANKIIKTVIDKLN